MPKLNRSKSEAKSTICPNLFGNVHLEFLKQSTAEAPDWTPTHPKGYFQPGVLALTGNGRVLFRWRGVPTHKNMGGATERPTAEHVWGCGASALEKRDASGDAPLDADPPLDSTGLPWPIFASLLIANGWFLNARGFKSARHIRSVGLRLLGFVGAWVAAFVWRPALPVAIALGGWIAFITPKLRQVGQQFQNVEVSSA